MSFTRFNDSNTINFKRVLSITYKLLKKTLYAYILLAKNIFILVIVVLLINTIIIVNWLVFFILF